MIGRPALWLLALLAALVLMPSGALAHHVRIVGSDPAPGARLEATPGQVRVFFDQAIEVPGSGLAVADRAGVRVDRSRASLVDDDALRLPLPPLAPGEYVVTWSTTSRADGEFTQGDFAFTVLPPAAPFVLDGTRLGGLAIVLAIVGALGILGGSRPAASSS